LSREPAMNSAIDMLSLRSILRDSPKFAFDNDGEEDQRFDATMLSKPQMRPLPFRDLDSWFEGKPHPRPYTQPHTDPHPYPGPLTQPVPEPCSLLLLGSGLVGLVFFRKKVF
jgi:hypothetical protein